MFRKGKIRTGFSLTEIMVVMAIIAILVAILMPTINKARESSNRVRCAANLRQIGQLMGEYAHDNRGNFPRTQYTAGSVLTYYTGAASVDPFAAASTVSPNDVTAALFLLTRTMKAPARLFVCPSSLAQPDTFGGLTANKRGNFTSVDNLSYSVACPYPDATAVSAGYRWNQHHPAQFALAADINPGVNGASNNVTVPTRTSPTKDQRVANSRNHNKAGQNVLYADGRVEFAASVFVGPEFDNIYTRQGTTVATNDTTTPLGFPRSKVDAVLGVIDQGAVATTTTTTTTGSGNGNANGNGNGNANGNGNGNANGNGNGNGNNGNGNGNNGNGNNGNGNGNNGNGNGNNGNGNNGRGNGNNGRGDD